jgi:acyl-CoA thioesterase FadM
MEEQKVWLSVVQSLNCRYEAPTDRRKQHDFGVKYKSLGSHRFEVSCDVYATEYLATRITKYSLL